MSKNKKTKKDKKDKLDPHFYIDLYKYIFFIKT